MERFALVVGIERVKPINRRFEVSVQLGMQFALGCFGSRPGPAAPRTRINDSISDVTSNPKSVTSRCLVYKRFGSPGSVIVVSNQFSNAA